MKAIMELIATLICGLVAGSLLLAFTASGESAGTEKPMLVYFGTYTQGKSKGIYVSRFDPATGRFSAAELAAETKNPSFLFLHPNQQFLYAVGEISDFQGKGTGAVSAYGLDAKTGKLTLLNQQPSGGAGPCHLAVDKTGRCVLVANYGSGSIAALSIQSDGQLGQPGTIIQHTGSSVDRQRQEGPHAHFIIPAPHNHFALACDLGLDQVLVYHLDPAMASLSPNTPAFCSIKPGSGPRHLAFHPNGRLAYLINEMGSSLTALSYDEKSGVLTELQTVSTLPEKFAGNNSCAEVQVHPSGKFVYGSNRGHDSIVVFATDSASGQLKYVEHQSTRGKTPRHFAIVPGGQWLVAENQDSNNVVVFRIDPDSGRLTPTGQPLEVGAPVCAQFVTAK